MSAAPVLSVRSKEVHSFKPEFTEKVYTMRVQCIWCLSSWPNFAEDYVLIYIASIPNTSELLTDVVGLKD